MHTYMQLSKYIQIIYLCIFKLYIYIYANVHMNVYMYMYVRMHVCTYVNTYGGMAYTYIFIVYIYI